MSIVGYLILGGSSALAFGVGCLISYFVSRKRGKTTTSRIQNVLEEAKEKASQRLREAELEYKEIIYKAKLEMQDEANRKRDEFHKKEKDLLDREENIRVRMGSLDEKEEKILELKLQTVNYEEEIKTRLKELNKRIQDEQQNLARLSRINPDQAKAMLLKSIEDNLGQEMAQLLEQKGKELQDKSLREAQRIISIAMQRCVVNHVSQTTVTSFKLPNEEVKGKLIGREGRNIRTFEGVTGVDLIIDETPDSVAISSFDGLRREIARIALTRLIADGRINPARIDEIVSQVRNEMNKVIISSGEKSLSDLGIENVHGDLVKALGSLKFKFYEGQNILLHCEEVAYLLGNMAAELGLDTALARRIGLFHDIGKAVSQEKKGSHALVGADLLAQCGESGEVVEAVRAHHAEVPQDSIYAVLAEVADQISIYRPGARKGAIESYMNRIAELEKIASSFQGVREVYALDFGKEVRVFVNPEKIDDGEAALLTRQIVNQIKKEVKLSSPVRVTVIRELKIVDSAKKDF